MMPGLDGYQVTARIKGNPATKNIPVIMVTALDDRDARMLGLNAGAEDFLTKPVDRAELCARVRNLLRLKAYGDYHDQYSQMLEAEVGARTADLVKSERRTTLALDAAEMGSFELDIADGYARAVAQARPDLRLHHASKRNGVRRICSACVVPEDLAAVHRAFEDAYRTGTFNLECRIRWPDTSAALDQREGPGRSRRPRCIRSGSWASCETPPIATGRRPNCERRKTPPRPPTGPRASSWRT